MGSLNWKVPSNVTCKLHIRYLISTEHAIYCATNLRSASSGFIDLEGNNLLGL